MFLVPFELITQLIKLVILLMESTPIELRRAQSAQWFWMWWPVTKFMIKEEYRSHVETIAKGGNTGSEPVPAPDIPTPSPRKVT